MYIYLYNKSSAKDNFLKEVGLYFYSHLHHIRTFFHLNYTLNVFLGISLTLHLTNHEIVAIM